MRYFTGIFLYFVGCSALASNVTETKISQISINKQYGNFVFIKLEKSPPRIECSKNGYWDYTLSLSDDLGKSMYSSLLSAYMAGKTLNISGNLTPDCNEFPTVESMAEFHIKN